MAIRSRKPTSAGRRFQTSSTYAEITKTSPEKSLVSPLSKSGGRNVYGRKTARHRGGGHKRQYRIIDFKRTKDGVTAKVAAIEYDPNRTCRIALLHYADGEKAYILAPKGLNVGDHVQSGHGSDIKPGNAMPLRFIPVGTTVHNVELRPGQGGKMGRSAGTAVVHSGHDRVTGRTDRGPCAQPEVAARSPADRGAGMHRLRQVHRALSAAVRGHLPPRHRRGHRARVVQRLRQVPPGVPGGLHPALPRLDVAAHRHDLVAGTGQRRRPVHLTSGEWAGRLTYCTP